MAQNLMLSQGGRTQPHALEQGSTYFKKEVHVGSEWQFFDPA